MPNALPRLRPIVLLILDGFGVAPDDAGNAVLHAAMPRWRALVRDYPAMTLQASGEAVGLSWGEMGNSEVGHLTLGAGRVYYQTLPRINRAIDGGEFFDNAALRQAMAHAKEHDSTLHIVGLIGEGRVHASSAHLYAVLELAKREGVERVAVHAILDGRDMLYNAGHGALEELLGKMQEIGVGSLASVSGRFYAMDRDNKWERTEAAYRAMAEGRGALVEDALAAIEASYAKEVFDEQLAPFVVGEKGKPLAVFGKNDAVIMTNFRPDRARQLMHAFADETFEPFARPAVEGLFVATMAEYEAGARVQVAFPPERVSKGFAEVISNMGLRQLHVAETEKYAHVTFFFNGTREELFPGEERALVPSPKVAGYNETPAMSVEALTDTLLQAVRGDSFDVIVANVANADMVGHTGDMAATVKGLEVVDACLGRIEEAVREQGGLLAVTADHGNAEEMQNLKTHAMDKEHSTNPVPFVLVADALRGKMSASGEAPDGDLSFVPPIGVLADVAPTLLTLMGITPPPDMTGQTLWSPEV